MNYDQAFAEAFARASEPYFQRAVTHICGGCYYKRCFCCHAHVCFHAGMEEQVKACYERLIELTPRDSVIDRFIERLNEREILTVDALHFFEEDPFIRLLCCQGMSGLIEQEIIRLLRNQEAESENSSPRSSISDF